MTVTLNKSLLFPGCHFAQIEKFGKFFWLTSKDAISNSTMLNEVLRKGAQTPTEQTTSWVPRA